MASTAWIESAARERKPAIGTGMEGNYQHTLVMARADEQREARDRVLAARTVQRLGREHAGELLDMLGLTPAPPAPARPQAKKLCSTCNNRKPASEFYPRLSARDGLCSQCRTCHAETKRQSAHRHRKAAET